MARYQPGQDDVAVSSLYLRPHHSRTGRIDEGAKALSKEVLRSISCIVAMLEENLERTFARDPYDQMGGYVKRSLGFNVYIKIENPLGQRVQQVFVGDEELQPGRYYPTTFVTEQGVAGKYGRNRQHHTERSVEALRSYLAVHSPLRAELRGTFVAV
jgi:hypothetical protein